MSLSTAVTYRILRKLGGVDVNSGKIIHAVAIMELVFAFGIVAFWAVFFSTDMVDIDDSRLKEVYLAFESAFPVPDVYLSVVLTIGGLGLLKRKYSGVLFSLMGGGSLIFLGLLDISFNARQGIYFLSVGEAVLNASINFLCVAFGLYLVRSIWKNRGRLKFFPALDFPAGPCAEACLSHNNSPEIQNEISSQKAEVRLWNQTWIT